MMMHRLDVHPNKCKPCRDPDNCTFKKCWYKHTDKIIIINENIRPEMQANFQKVSTQLKPPLNNTQANVTE